MRALARRLAAQPPPPPSLPDPSARAAALALLQCVSCWPADDSFPAVDLLRLALLREGERVALVELGGELVRATLGVACGEGAPPAAQMLGLRLLANCCAHARTAAMLAPHREAIVERCGALRSSERAGTRLAAATVLLNLAVLAANAVGDFEARVQLVSSCAAALEERAAQPAAAAVDAVDSEAAYRLTVAGSTLCLADGECAALARALGMDEHARALGAGALGTGTPKLAEALGEDV
mgnify:CR=1 FL=1